MSFDTAFQATAFQSSAFQVGTVGEVLPSAGGAGGGSRAYRKRLRQSLERRHAFEDERQKRIEAIGVEVERPPLKPAPETVTMFKRLLDEPIRIDWPTLESPQPVHDDDGGEEELLLLLFAD